MAFLQYEGVGISAMAAAVPKRVVKNREYTEVFTKAEADEIKAKEAENKSCCECCSENCPFCSFLCKDGKCYCWTMYVVIALAVVFVVLIIVLIVVKSKSKKKGAAKEIAASEPAEEKKEEEKAKK